MLADHQHSHYHHHYHYHHDHCHPNRHPLFPAPSGPFRSLHTTHLSPPPAVFSTGGGINIHLGPYTGLLSDGVSGRAVWRLLTQWPTNESRETKHSYTPRASKDHPFNTNTHMRRACRAGRWAERESGGGVGRKNERVTDGCWERWGHRAVESTRTRRGGSL